MKKTGDIAVITNVSVEPFLSRELSALSDVIDIPVEAVSVPLWNTGNMTTYIARLGWYSSG